MVRTDLSDTDPLTLINVQDLYLFSQNILLFNNSANFAMLIKRFQKSLHNFAMPSALSTQRITNVRQNVQTFLNINRCVSIV